MLYFSPGWDTLVITFVTLVLLTWGEACCGMTTGTHIGMLDPFISTLPAKITFKIH